jgi:hypothetical protein
MKTKAVIGIFLACLCIFVAASGNAISAPLVGGYSSADATSDDVKAAAEFAVRAQAGNESEPLALVTVAQAEKQVVAGLNYRLTLTVTKGKKTVEAKVVVYHALDSHYQLTSWEWVPAI